MARPRRVNSISALEALRPFRWRISLTYGLTFLEDLLELSYPWATGIAINGLLDRDFRLAFTYDAVGHHHRQLLTIGGLIIVKNGTQLMVRTRDGRYQFDIAHFFSEIMMMDVVDSFKILGAHSYTPRVTIDRLVVSRETWRFAPLSLPFANDKSEVNRFLGARRWAREHGLPRQVFVKAPIERKPFYVDFDSPILVNILAKTARRMAEQGAAASLLTMTEMYPALDQLWLPDTDDHYYTSELRIVAVDQRCASTSSLESA